jgi:hypothetical protein
VIEACHFESFITKRDDVACSLLLRVRRARWGREVSSQISPHIFTLFSARSAWGAGSATAANPLWQSHLYSRPVSGSIFLTLCFIHRHIYIREK